jgi:hypothetical protein
MSCKPLDLNGDIDDRDLSDGRIISVTRPDDLPKQQNNNFFGGTDWRATKKCWWECSTAILSLSKGTASLETGNAVFHSCPWW